MCGLLVVVVPVTVASEQGRGRAKSCWRRRREGGLAGDCRPREPEQGKMTSRPAGSSSSSRPPVPYAASYERLSSLCVCNVWWYERFKRRASTSRLSELASFCFFPSSCPPRRPTESHPTHHHNTQNTTKPTSQLPGCLLRLFLLHGPLESPSQTQATTPAASELTLSSLPPSLLYNAHSHGHATAGGPGPGHQAGHSGPEGHLQEHHSAA